MKHVRFKVATSRTIRSNIVILVGVAALAMTASAAVAAPHRDSRSATCDAIAQVPYVDAPSRTGGAEGGA